MASPKTNLTESCKRMAHESLEANGIAPDSDVYWDDAAKIIDETTDLIGASRVALMDKISRRWLVRQGSPYLDEMDFFAEKLGRPGTYLLNLSLEWACTVKLFVALEGGTILRRTFD